MRISRVYTDLPLALGSTIELAKEASHYLANVLRLKEGNCVHLFNGTDGEFEGKIISASKNSVSLSLLSKIADADRAKLQIHLGLGLSRGERMDFAIQKSTELGVTEITPVITEHGEVRLKGDRVENRLRHWRKIAIAASEQCGRVDVPLIHEPIALSQWCAARPAGMNILLDPRGETAFVESSEKPALVNLLVGAEGGFSSGELALAQEKKFLVTKLGSRVLRTETAPVAAIAILQYVYGDI